MAIILLQWQQQKKVSELNQSRGRAKTRPPMQTLFCLFASFHKIQWSQVLCGVENSVGETDSFGDCWSVLQKHGFLISSLKDICHVDIPWNVTLNQRHTECDTDFHLIHNAFIQLTKWLHEHMKTYKYECYFPVCLLEIKNIELIFSIIYKKHKVLFFCV